MWKAAAIVLLSLSLPSHADSARIGVRAVILPYLQMRTMHQPQVLNVTREDVARGYVEVPGAYELEVKTNTGAVRLRLAATHPVAARVSVQHVDSDAEVRQTGSGFSMRKAERVFRASLRAAARVELASGAAEGVYPWPAQLTASAD